MYGVLTPTYMNWSCRTPPRVVISTYSIWQRQESPVVDLLMTMYVRVKMKASDISFWLAFVQPRPPYITTRTSSTVSIYFEYLYYEPIWFWENSRHIIPTWFNGYYPYTISQLGEKFILLRYNANIIDLFNLFGTHKYIVYNRWLMCDSCISSQLGEKFTLLCYNQDIIDLFNVFVSHVYSL